MCKNKDKITNIRFESGCQHGLEMKQFESDIKQIPNWQ